MNFFRIPYSNIDAISAFDKSYSVLDDRLSSFYQYIPDQKGIEKAIQQRTQYPLYRDELVETLTTQYEKIEMIDSSRESILALHDPNTFTVTTAHQLNILTGPLYYIYKILTAIRLSKKMNASEEYNIIPIFVLGGEDHDFDEIDHTSVYGKQIKWNRDKSGAVGRMTTESLEHVLAELYDILGEEQTAKIMPLFNESYLKYKNYGRAVQKMVAEIFKDYNLLVLNMDDQHLKSIFKSVFLDEIKNLSIQKLVNESADLLEDLNLKVQVRPRDINLFYLSDGNRQRITFDGESYRIVDTDQIFTLDQMINLIETEPHNISPNVLLRPLYQEMILPNVCFIGGGGELAYWIELKTSFEYHNVHYPALMRRESVLWIDRRMQRKIDKLELPSHLFFRDADTIIRNFLEINSTVSFEFETEQEKLDELFQIIKEKAKRIDSTLASSIEAEHTKWNKSLSQLESRLVRAEKKKSENAINQIRNIKEKLFPNNGLQERRDNFLPLYLEHGQAFFASLLEAMDPFDPGFLVVVDDE